MAELVPKPISAVERVARLRRIRRVARSLGFVGRIEYRHVFSSSGGAQFGLGPTPEQDLLAVYAEAFVRDDNPGDFSLEAIVAHERGHQFVCRNSALQRFLINKVAPTTEEILASLVGSLIVEKDTDRQALFLKALEEAAECGLGIAESQVLVIELREILEQLL